MSAARNRVSYRTSSIFTRGSYYKATSSTLPFSYPKIYLYQPQTTLSYGAYEEAAKRARASTFDYLANLWQADTAHLSSPQKRKQHYAFKELAAMSPDVIPLLLKRLVERPDNWFPLLRSISGEDPVVDNERGDWSRMKEAWINWGISKRLITRNVLTGLPKS